MQDRFRFRVYYKPHNKVYNVICLNCDRQKEIIIEYKGSTAIVEWKNCEIIQCTGLKDKNDKLIYEGDIVKIHNDVTAKIIFDKGCFSFTDGVYNQACYWKKDTLEVIGNIYENPL